MTPETSTHGTCAEPATKAHAHEGIIAHETLHQRLMSEATEAAKSAGERVVRGLALGLLSARLLLLALAATALRTEHATAEEGIFVKHAPMEVVHLREKCVEYVEGVLLREMAPRAGTSRLLRSSWGKATSELRLEIFWLIHIHTTIIVFTSLSWVAQDFIGFSDEFKLLTGFCLVVRILIRVPSDSQLTVTLFDKLRSGILRQSQRFVVVRHERDLLNAASIKSVSVSEKERNFHKTEHEMCILHTSNLQLIAQFYCTWERVDLTDQTVDTRFLKF